MLDGRMWESVRDEKSFDEAIEVAVRDLPAVALLEDRSERTNASTPSPSVEAQAMQEVVPRAQPAADSVVDRLLKPLGRHDRAEVDEGPDHAGARDLQPGGLLGEVKVRALVDP